MRPKINEYYMVIFSKNLSTKQILISNEFYILVFFSLSCEAISHLLIRVIAFLRWR
jgi:hypothetical protein